MSTSRSVAGVALGLSAACVLFLLSLIDDSASKVGADPIGFVFVTAWSVVTYFVIAMTLALFTAPIHIRIAHALARS